MQLDPWQKDHDDRRASPRTAARIDATLEHPAGAFSGFVVDIAFGGANFVTQTVAPVLAIGCDVVLTVASNPDAVADQLSWSGTVVRCERSGDDGPDRIAYAIEFDESAARAVPDPDALD